MDYEEHCKVLLNDLQNNRTPERFDLACKTLSLSIVAVVATLQDHKRMHEYLDMLFDMINETACKTHTKLHGLECGEIDAETFLRDVYNPGEFNG